MQTAAKRYLQTQVTTTSQGDVVVMLYDGALKFLNQAKARLAVNDMAGKGIAISKALDIINELDSVLNVERGGALAANLHSLYMFSLNHLVKANLKKSTEMIEDVIKILSGLRSAYAEILSMPEAQAAAQEAATTIRVAMQPSRNQPGNSSTGAENLAPGAGARIRKFFSKNSDQNPAADTQGEAAAGQSPLEGTDGTAVRLFEMPGAAVSQPLQAKTGPANAAASPDVQTGQPRPAAPQATPQSNPGGVNLAGVGFNSNNSVRKTAGADLYRKFAGQ